MKKVVKFEDRKKPKEKAEHEEKRKQFPKAEELIALSTIDLSDISTPRQRLEILRDALIYGIPILQGMLIYRPTQGSAYALTNLTSQIQSLDDQIASMDDPETVAQNVIDSYVVPAMESLSISLGKIITGELKTLNVPDPGMKIISKFIDRVYTSFGKSADEHIGRLKTEITEYYTS